MYVTATTSVVVVVVASSPKYGANLSSVEWHKSCEINMKAPGPMMTINVCLLGNVIFVFAIYALEISYARHFHMYVYV